MRKIICFFFGHAWVYDSLLGSNVCLRCGKIDPRWVKRRDVRSIMRGHDP